MNDPYAEKGNKRIKNDPERFPIIKEAWRMMLTGDYTPPEILKKINNELGYRTPRRKTIGGKPMARSQLYQVFSDAFYYGTFEFPLGSGNWKEGKHESMITEEEFWRVQQLLGRKERQRPHKHSFPYTGIIRIRDATRTAEKPMNIRSLEDFYLESPVMLPTSDLNPMESGSMGVPEGRPEEGNDASRSGIK